MKKYKKVSECPPILCELIEVYNVLPYDLFFVLDDFKKLIKDNAPAKEIEAYIQEGFEQFHPDLQEYLTNNCGNDVWLWLDALSILYADKSTLVSIQERAENERLLKKCKEQLKEKGEKLIVLVNEQPVENFDCREFFFIEDRLKIITPFISILLDSSRTVTHPFVNEKGIIELKHVGLSEAIQKAPIEADRIRRCEYCRRIYWAKKKNSETCGTKRCIEGLGNKKRLAKKKT